MKVSSFMPAVTQMIYDLGLQDLLDGITFECPQVALKEKTPVVRCVLEGKSYTSDEINTLFSKSKASGESLYFVDEVALAKIAPDVVFTQDVCDVCQIDTECASLAVNKLAKIPELISITPQSLEDVFDNVITIAKALDQEVLGKDHVTFLKNKIADIVDKQREARVMPKSVMLLEWIDPLFNCGHWIPHQIGYAGGIDLLSHPSGDSIVIDWQKIVKYNPEVLVIAPCGYTQERTLEDMKFLEAQPEWKTLRAVQNKQVYLADFDLFTQSSASTLVDGIIVLSKIFHPTVFTEATGLEHKYCNYFDKK
ncbi:ABC transporter substrate-binding protein [Wenyingzhuangia marina]|uniref:Iron complex transport system substrate-binding protein n=1 Tax=Wenyingzhuangia marina TaxID=1195760 RepID=A0A1M5WP29_9FLAO|nr:ABC transporter substrate-binding protein [Wenyingzhuangia marina]GGF79650.1 cobalamin-binding protein [Wenyingzhuangia marina]SHH89251.1 iron complex transport system substrate-binding protein [Wenyingzhuangia marina]